MAATVIFSLFSSYIVFVVALVVALALAVLLFFFPLLSLVFF